MKAFITFFFSILGSILLAGEVVLLSVTDTHAHVDALRRLAPLIRAEQSTHTDALLIDAGDTLQGTFYAIDPAGVPMRIANELGVELWTPGNHDFEIFPLRFTDFRGTVLGANWSTREFRPTSWTLLRRGAYRIAFIGLTEHNLPSRLPFDSTIAFEPPEEALRRIMPEVRKARPDLIVLICHDGPYFRGGSLHKTLRPYPEIDLVIGGHTHQESSGERIGRTWFVQAGKHAEALARITVEFDDATGKLRRVRATLLHPAPDAPRAAFSVELERELARIEADSRKPVGTLPQTIAVTGSKIYAQAYADLLGDAMRRTANASCAIHAGGAFQMTMPRGTLTRGDLFRLMPFENRICMVRLTPDELRAIVEEECRILAKGRRSVLFSGLDVQFDRKGTLLSLRHPEPDADGRIRVAFTDYYLAGGGGLTQSIRRMLEKNKTPVISTGVLLRDAISAQLQAGERQ